MSLTLLAILAASGARLTPEVLMDREFAEHGYAVLPSTGLSMSPLETKPDDSALTLAARLKNVWRIRESKTHPGVYLPEVTTHLNLIGRKTQNVPTMVQEPLDPLPPKSLSDLAKPGGTRLMVKDLEGLYKLPYGTVPWIYARRTVTVRIDPKRIQDPVAFLAAILDAKTTKDNKRVAFDARGFRRLAVPTFQRAANETEVRRLKMGYMLAQFAHERMDDAKMEHVYAKQNSSTNMSATGLEERWPGFIRTYVDNWIESFGKDQSGRDLFFSMTNLQEAPLIEITPNGYGLLAFKNNDGDGLVVF